MKKKAEECKRLKEEKGISKGNRKVKGEGRQRGKKKDDRGWKMVRERRR